MEGVNMKKCKSCSKLLPFDSFTPSKILKDGYENKCRNCRNEQRKKYINSCTQCGDTFRTSTKNAKYCSNNCIAASRIRRTQTNCKECNKAYEIVPSRKGESSFCSNECKYSYQERLKGELNANYKRIDHECDGCGKTIQVKPSKKENQKYIFCSNACYKRNIGDFFKGDKNGNYVNRVLCKCETCGNEFEKLPHLVNNKNFCSRKCLGVALTKKNKAISESVRVEVECANCGKKHKVIPSHLKRKVLYCSRECMDVHYNQTFNLGENHPKYRFDLTDEERELKRNIPGYAEWRTGVYERDNYTCVVCNRRGRGDLNAHHLYSYSTHKHLRTELINGVTLCKKCHYEFHNHFGFYDNTKEQFEEFKNAKQANLEPSILETI